MNEEMTSTTVTEASTTGQIEDLFVFRFPPSVAEKIHKMVQANKFEKDSLEFLFKGISYMMNIQPFLTRVPIKMKDMVFVNLVGSSTIWCCAICRAWWRHIRLWTRSLTISVAMLAKCCGFMKVILSLITNSQSLSYIENDDSDGI